MAITTESLQTYLGMTTDGGEFDTARATLLLDLATKIITPITGSPVPDSADPIMLSCVVRAYLNPTNATNLTAGPYTAAFPAGGVYLTKAERGALQRAIGQGYHFAVEALPKQYRQAPGPLTLSPATGTVAGGDLVTITGVNLDEAFGVTIDGASVAFTVNADLSLSFTTPSHAAGAVDVLVGTPYGWSAPATFTFA